MTITKKNIDEYQCFVNKENWDELGLAQKIELVVVCRMEGGEIGEHLNESEKELYYNVLESGE